MIPQIKEINFPEYATLSTATASLVDMGDKTITAQVKIDGAIAPDFSYDWEIEFQGERYIQPLRKPQGSKGNESISSIIDLTFYHKGIYDLKRYFFVSTVELEAGTIMADNYIVPLRLNIAEFVTYFNNVLKYYYGKTYKVFLNPDYEYDETDRKDIDINYTKIWDVITKIYEWFGVRWAWDTHSDNGEYYFIKIGHPSTNVSHIFEYGFEGGLLKFESQVQNAEIANVVFGRGSSENIPYRYFKNKSEDNPTFPADPDWIPELENIYFANLRGKTFRDYVQGWKTNPNRDTKNGTISVQPYNAQRGEIDFAYKKGHEDATFNPIEYVHDDESIAKYGEIQKGLEHNEEIKPTIQGVTIDGVGRVDQIVDVEPILVDESTENTEWESKVENIDYTEVASDVEIWNIDSYTITSYSNSFTIPQGHKGSFLKDYNISAIQRSKCNVSYYKYGIDMDLIGGETKIIDHNLAFEIKKVEVVDETDNPLDNIVNIEGGTTVKVKYEIVVSGFLRRDSEVIRDYPNYENTPIQVVTEAANLASINLSLSWQLDYTPIHGQILGNYESGATRKSLTKTISAQGTSQVVFRTEEFTISENDAPATSVEMPYRITSSLKGGEYDPRPNVVAINVETDEQMTSLNLPAGTYYLQNSIQIKNLSNKEQTFKVELLPTYIYYSYDSASWKPTFDIWVKNIWQTNRKWTDPVDGVAKPETDEQYATRVWDAILGSHLGEDAKIVFSSGRLSGHSDYEFTIARRPVYDNSRTLDGVPSEWRITLYKSDAEMEAIDKWLPSIMTQASAGDHFYFVGIEMPHQYVLWAEERLDKYKCEELDKVSDVDSTIVVQLDKVRLNQLQEGETRPLLNSVRVGNNIKVADSRFIQSPHETLRLQSVTYTWDASTIMLPNIEVVLSDEITTYSNPFEDINRKIDDAEDRIKDVRKTSLAQIDKAKKSIRNTSSKINTLSARNANVVNQVNALIGSPDDARKSVREIAEDVLGEFGEESLDDYLKKNEAKETYATKESLDTTNDSIDGIATRLGKAETNIGNNSNLLSAHSQQLQTLRTEQESQKATIQQQGATILALDLEVDDIKGDVSEANKAIDAIEVELGDKVDKSVVDSLSKDLVSTKEVIETKVGKGDLKSLTYKVNGVSQTFNGLSEATIPQIFTPTQIGSQGQVLQSMGGGAPQWANLSDIKEAVGFAKDLTGVLEATPEEFTFRPSAGDKSIRDESAVIRRIKGNTVIFAQLADHASALQREGDWSVAVEVTTNTWGPFSSSVQVIANHKYLFCINKKDGRSITDTYTLLKGAHRVDFDTPLFITSTETASWTWTARYQTSTNGLRFQTQAFDLTNLFGAGNEPTTLEEFKRSYPDSYYPYCEPEIRNMRAWGIETISANAFNKDDVVNGSLSASGTIISYDTKYWVAKIEVVPGKRYSLHNIATIRYNYALYDSNNKFLSADGIKDTTTNLATTVDIDIPNDARYISVVVHNDYLDSCCVNLRHSGTFNVGDTTYFKKVRDLSEIETYFPDGMNSVGEVCDEINAENAILRCGMRLYKDGDENDPNVITDRTNTVYKLAEPIVMPITEPLQLDYEVADFGTEKALTAPKSSPFRADIVYQFNAEGRIRDNSRNIERIEAQTRDFATRDYVIKVMPTEIATATPLHKFTSFDEIEAIIPNIMYEYASGLGQNATVTLPPLAQQEGAYDHVWMLRLPSIANSNSLQYPYTIKWKDGTPPTFVTACTLEIYLKMDGAGAILGEWKIYR